MVVSEEVLGCGYESCPLPITIPPTMRPSSDVAQTNAQRNTHSDTNHTSRKLTNITHMRSLAAQRMRVHDDEDEREAHVRTRCGYVLGHSLKRRAASVDLNLGREGGLVNGTCYMFAYTFASDAITYLLPEHIVVHVPKTHVRNASPRHTSTRREYSNTHDASANILHVLYI